MYSVMQRIQNVLSFEGFSGRISRKGCYCYQICDGSLHTFYLATVKSIKFLLSSYNMGARCIINNYRLKIFNKQIPTIPYICFSPSKEYFRAFILCKVVLNRKVFILYVL